MSCFGYQNELLANPFLAFPERAGDIVSRRSCSKPLRCDKKANKFTLFASFSD